MFFNIFDTDPKTKKTQKEIEEATSCIKYVTAAGGLVAMALTVAVAAVKLNTELKK